MSHPPPLQPRVREVLDGAPIAHVATVLPDGAPHAVPVWIGTHAARVAIFTGPQSRKAHNLRADPRVAISITTAENPFEPVTLRGKVVEWVDGDAGWAIIDEISQKYTGGSYPRGQERIALLIEPERQHVGVG